MPTKKWQKTGDFFDLEVSGAALIAVLGQFLPGIKSKKSETAFMQFRSVLVVCSVDIL
ncbi:hypothetical protein [Pyruvatibacter sp. HU-CL02332]|uniref:hypothetical protein n=1 Tax=Pyruvatibacter sp. HU-CL02332 TaxID=3127650 RepID=UPI00296927DE|nr:hypothetical protein [Alphaproteobacteria bacterium]